MPVFDVNVRIRVKQDGPKVVFDILGVGSWVLTHEAAKKLAVRLAKCSAAARDHAEHEIVIADQAALIGMGAPFGVSSSAKIHREAVKKAEHDLRPGYLKRKPPANIESVASREIVPPPAIFVHPPRKATPDA